jgi:hypothetical protein
MKRNKFIATSFFAALLPLTNFANTMKKIFRNDKGFKVDAGKDRFDKTISLFGRRHNFLPKFLRKIQMEIFTCLNLSEIKKADRLYIFIMHRMNIGTYWKENFYLK